MSLLREAGEVGRLKITKYRLAFTIEDGKLTGKLSEGFGKVYLHGQKPNSELLSMEVTKGHFNRGVE